MGKKECHEVIEFLNAIDPEQEFSEFCYEMIKEEWPLDPAESEDPEEIRSDAIVTGVSVGLAAGYFLGKSKKITDPKTKAAARKIKRRLVHKGLLGRQD